MHTVLNIRNKFMDLLSEKNFTIDKTGVKTVEIIGESFLVGEDKIFGTVNWDYVQRELEWYLSQSLSVYDIPYHSRPFFPTPIYAKNSILPNALFQFQPFVSSPFDIQQIMIAC